MVDVDDARLADGLKRASDVVMSRIKIGRATPQDLANMLGSARTRRHQPTIFADCDVVIEAITENEAVKKEVYQELAGVIRDDAILASNTSTISITRHGRVGPASRAVRRDALLQPGRSHGAGRGDPGREDQRRDGRDDRRPGQADPQDADRRQGLRRASW